MDKKIETQLIQSILFEMSEYAIFIMDREGYIKSWNVGAQRIKNYTEEEIVGKNFRVFYTEEDKEVGKPNKLIQMAIAENRAIDEGWRVRKDGSRFWASVVISTIHDERGETIGFTKITRDLTKQKQAKERFKNIIENAPDAMLIIDQKGFIQMANQQTENIFGYTKEDLIGQNMEMLMPSKEKRYEFFDKYLADPDTPLTDSESCIDCCGLRKDGEEIPVEISISPLEKNNANSHIIILIRDVTEKKQLMDEILEAKRKVEESNRLKSAFLATMNHELKTPLNHILGSSDIIMDSTDNEEVLEYAGIIKKSGNDLLQIVDDIFNLAMIENNNVKVRRESIGMSEFYIELKTLSNKIFSESDKKDKIKMLFNVYDNMLLFRNIDTDKYKIYQVITNLVNNAVKYTEQGTIVISLHQPEETSIAVSIQDTGIGIPYDKQKEIFEYFRQADDSETRIFGGIGAGLTIADRIAHILGGEIEVQSEPGKGSNFTFTFPVQIKNGVSKKLSISK